MTSRVMILPGLLFLWPICAGIGSGDTVRNISLPPVSTFKAHCARCHGYEGSALGREFGGLTADSLRSVTEEMMFGPAGLNPDSIDVDAMTAYSASLKKSVPFASVLNAGSFLHGTDSTLRLEISPGAEVGVDDTTVAVRGGKIFWELMYNPKKNSVVTITIRRGSAESKLRFPDELWVQ